MTEMHFLLKRNLKKYYAWSCQHVGDALNFLLNNIFIRFGTKLYRQVVGIPMDTNCASLVAYLILCCYERDFMMSLSDDKQADVIDALNTTSRYLDDILNINNVYFDNMVSQIYPSELQLNKANTSDTEAAFLDLHLSIYNDIVSTKIYDKRDDFDFEIVNFPFLDGDVPRSTSYGVYISQLIRFARASSYVADFNTRNKLLTQKLLKQGYWYHKLCKTFSKFYRRYYDLISKFQSGLKSLLRQGLSIPDFYGDLVYKLKKIVGSNKTFSKFYRQYYYLISKFQVGHQSLLRQGLSERDFYGDLVYKLKKIVGSNNFSAQFIKIISHYKKIGYNINVLPQSVIQRTCYKTLVYKTHFVIDLYTAYKKLCFRIMNIDLDLICNFFYLDSKLFAHSIFDHLKLSMESLNAYLMSFWNFTEYLRVFAQCGCLCPFFAVPPSLRVFACLCVSFRVFA